jgi:hypothetical protein
MVSKHPESMVVEILSVGADYREILRSRSKWDWD